MTPDQFIAKWAQVTTNEKASSQSHFNDLCLLLGEPQPHDVDPIGEWFAFEKGAAKTGAGHGWADVWKKGCFGWEYKAKGKDLAAALKQLQLYALALESPPLLIVSDIETIEIHTAFQNAVQESHAITLAGLADPQNRQKLKWAFSEPERLRPSKTRFQITGEAAARFAALADALRSAGHDAQGVAHFLNRLLFCMFAEDAGVLPVGIFTEITTTGVEHPEHIDSFLKGLFRAMKDGGPFGTQMIAWFNGGLFEDDSTLPLTQEQMRIVRDLSQMDWSQIEPSIFGTLFERGLDPAKRSQLGAQYTDPGTIMRLVGPTIVDPLLQEWGAVKSNIVTLLSKPTAPSKKRSHKGQTAGDKAALKALQAFLSRLRSFRILDPACGSGNFLYLSLRALKDIEHRALIEAEELGLQRQFPTVGPECVHGIEVNAYAAELARVTIWIGDLQWMISHGYSWGTTPVLKPLDSIELRDAILNPDGTEPDWPPADVIVGNPPFLGDKKMLRELGDSYVHSLRKLYEGRVPGGADLVTYWYEKARSQIAAGKVAHVGLVATNSIRGGRNRKVLERLLGDATIYNAWGDEPWVNDGAAVRVSLLCFGPRSKTYSPIMDGHAVSRIHADLTAGGHHTSDTPDSTASSDLTRARRLQQNKGIAFIGGMKKGKFDVTGSIARQWLQLPANPNGRSNADVLRPWCNGKDIVQRPSDTWIVAFPEECSVSDAALYEAPHHHVLTHVKPERDKVRNPKEKARWWIHARTAPDLHLAIVHLDRFIVTPRVAKHRVFTWLRSPVVCDGQLVVIARQDDAAMGVLQSRFHELWALRLGTSLEDRPRYTPTSTFDTFPFPSGLTPDLNPTQYTNAHAAEVSVAARELVELRDRWLNPSEWVDVIPEVVDGYPHRIVPKAGHEADLAKRTLTKLYNQQPSWLVNAHRKLDETVSAAYGWPADLSDEEILSRLLELNLSRV